MVPIGNLHPKTSFSFGDFYYFPETLGFSLVVTATGNEAHSTPIPAYLADLNPEAPSMPRL